MCHTYAIDEHTRKNEIEDIEHGPASDPDGVGDVRVGGGAAAVVDQVVGAGEGLQAELPIDLVVGHVTAVVHIRIHQVKLEIQITI